METGCAGLEMRGAMAIEDFKGVQVLDLFHNGDARGSFTKIYNRDNLERFGIHTRIEESYYSVSQKDVIRGMHFQLPPHEHEKIVHVLRGEIVDVILDLRKGSETYGKCFSIRLCGEEAKALYIPCGFAHGFRTLCDDTLMLYYVSSGYAPQSDTGIRWDSIGYDWNTKTPILSERDQTFVKFADFQSPFYL